MNTLFDRLIAEGFERVERDDRLLDVFPDEISEKGIELWDKWNGDTIEIVRIHLQRGEQGVSRHRVPRTAIERALLHNQRMVLQ